MARFGDGTARKLSRRCAVAAALTGLAACSGDPAPGPEPATVARHDLSVDGTDPARFFDLPFPSDLRLDDAGRPDLRGFPVSPNADLFEPILARAGQRVGLPTTPVAYFRFSAPLTPRLPSDRIAAAPDAPLLLIDVDPSSPDRGTLLPTVASTPTPDGYVPDHLLAVASWPGFVLAPERTYAFVVTNHLLDAQGAPIGPDEDFAALRDGAQVATPAGSAAAATFAPLWPALELAGVDRRSVISAAVFTTGDVVAELADLSDAVRSAHEVTIEGLAVDPDDGADHERFCELHGTVSFPQFQRGEPPFDEEGQFELDSSGLPVVQRQELAPIVIALPKRAMPEAGFPLVLYFHGSGGLAAQVVDRGRVTEPGGEPTKGEGPAHVLAAHGFATAGSAHPVNPERLPGASDIAYLNFDNLAAFPDTFRQGVLEQRLYLDALLELTIDPALVASCSGLSLPAGQSGYRFDVSRVLATGQSMGGMYTNLIGAIDPRIGAVVPTGAGGYWSFFFFETSLIGGKTLVPLLLGSATDTDYLHPAVQIVQMAFEPSEPMVYMPRLARRPLPGHPVRPVYEPVGLGDSYFPTAVYDAMVLAYGNAQAGEVIWPSMQEALALAGLDGIAPYPVADNLGNDPDVAHTGVVVQYEGDGIYDPHAIYGQLDAVKHQYGCFFETFWSTGTATVPAPAPLGTPCVP